MGLLGSLSTAPCSLTPQCLRSWHASRRICVVPTQSRDPSCFPAKHPKGLSRLLAENPRKAAQPGDGKPSKARLASRPSTRRVGRGYLLRTNGRNPSIFSMNLCPPRGRVCRKCETLKNLRKTTNVARKCNKLHASIHVCQLAPAPLRASAFSALSA